MYFPSQTSLLPVTAALARFWQEQGISAITQNYPYWYFGSTPYRYLTGPVIPIFINGISSLMRISLIDSLIYMVFVSILLSAVGWAIFSILVSGKKIYGFISFFVFLVLPWKYLSALSLSEGSMVIARSLMPYYLIFVWLYFSKNTHKYALASLAAILTLLLISYKVIPLLILGGLSVALGASYKNGAFNNFWIFVKRGGLLFVFAILLSMYWYTPGFYFTLLKNPSIGGKPAYLTFTGIIDLARVVIPFVAAAFTVRLGGQVKSRYSVFALAWTLTFIFISAYRFINDVDFWMDWTAWMWEIEAGMALIAPIAASSLLRGREMKLSAIALLVLVLPLFLTFRIYIELGRPALITKTKPYPMEVLQKLEETTKGDTVFLSGSTVFWANMDHNIRQVRGGMDEVATDPNWREAAWELREGKDPQKSLEWIRNLGITHVLVHEALSSEYYHDFRHTGKWQEIGERVWEGDGDIIYRF